MIRTFLLALSTLLACRAPRSAQAPAAAMPPKATSVEPPAYSDTTIGPAATGSDARAAALFTRDYYQWYTSHDYNLAYAVQHRPEVFGRELLAALRADFAASAKSPGEVVGLDWEPFSGSQDPCGPYQPTRTARRGDTILVAMRGMCTDAEPRPVPDAVPELVYGRRGWQFIDIRHGADGGTLRQDLATIKAARDSSRAKPRR